MSSRRRLLIALVAVVALATIGAIVASRFVDIKFDMGGSHFVGAGAAELDIRLFDVAPFKINRTALRADAIRLNQAGTDSKKWSLDFFSIPISSPGLPATAELQLSIELDAAPAPGTLTAGILHGPRLTAELFSGPTADPKLQRLNSKTLRNGQLSISAAQLNLDGKLTGQFKFSAGADELSGTFDLVLKAAPPLVAF